MWRQALRKQLLSNQFSQNKLRQSPASLFCHFSSTTTQKPAQEEQPENKRSSTNPTENYHHAAPKQNQHAIGEELYTQVLSQVPHHGWTSASVHEALTSLNLSPASSALLPTGIATVAARLDANCNRQLALHLFERQVPVTDIQDEPEKQSDKENADGNIDDVKEQPDKPKTDGNVDDVNAQSDKEQVVVEQEPADRAAYAMIYRLSLLDPYHQFWYQAVSLRARTPRKALRNRLLLTDEIAAYANYPSADMSWYTDRAVFAAIYQAAELCWITDTSRHRIDTKNFIETRCENADHARRTMSNTYSQFMTISDAVSRTAGTLFRSARSSY